MKSKFRQVSNKDIHRWLNEDRKVSIKPYVPLKQHKDTSINFSLDCHGKTVQQSFIEINNFIEDHYFLKTKSITIITGKSGQIHLEFSAWMKDNKFVRYIKLLQNKGSWKVYLRKN